MPADERRIDRTHERIIDLKITQRINALALHQIERATPV